MLFKPKKDPMNGWATPFVTGHKYKIHWGMTGIDFEQMQYSMSERWEVTDQAIYFVHNFSDIRAEVNFSVSTGVGSRFQRPNNSIPSTNIRNTSADF